MKTEIYFRPVSIQDAKLVAVKPFKLDNYKECCHCCGKELKSVEKKFKSTIRYYAEDGKLISKEEVPVCFDCIEKVTGRRPDYERNK